MTRERRARMLFAVCAVAAVALPAGANALDVTEPACDLRSTLSIQLPTCPQEQAPEPHAGPSAKSPPVTTRPVPASPIITAPIAQVERDRSPRTGGTTPQSFPSARPIVAPEPAVQPVPQPESRPVATAARPAWEEGIAVAFMALATALLVWIMAIRWRSRRHDEVDRLKEDLVSNLSHELFTPLTQVMIGAQLMADGRLSGPQARRVAEQMMSASRQLERRIDTLVTYATLRRGDFSPGADAVALVGLVNDVTADRGDGRVSVRVAEPIPAIRADERLLRIAVGELIDNAVKFSPDGGTIEVALSRSLGGDRDARIQISITDPGIGMDQTALAAAFDEFRQLDASSTRRFGGVGLGLTLADGIARLHGGEVVATSAPGRGSTFALWIPERAARSSARPVRAA